MPALALVAWLAPLCLGLSPASSQPRPVPPERIAAAVGQIDRIVAEAMAATGVPGIAVAVVKDGEILHARGYGVRVAGGGLPVEPETVFQVASVSKPLAATVVARQVGAGIVAWDSPVRRHLPDFALADPWVSERVTIADLFAHRSGLPGHAGDDLEDIGFGRTEVLRRLRLLPLGPFRSSYAYTNFGLTAAAEAVAVASGMGWDSLSETVLYRPLGMGSTSSRLADFLAARNRAVGHTLAGGAFAPLAIREPDAQSAAGGVSSTVTDLARWMAMVMGGGVLDGRRIVAEGALAEALAPAIAPRASGTPARLPSFYGYGIGVREDRGVVLLSHSGAFVLGAASNFVMIPAERLGIVVLSNASPVGAVEAIAATFADLVLHGAATRDWLSFLAPAFAPFLRPTGELVGAARPEAPAPARQAADYVGRYESAYFGPLEVSERAGGIEITLGPNRLGFPLAHWSGDTFVFPVFNENAPQGSVSRAVFAAAEGGRVEAVTVEFLDRLGLGRFERSSR